MATNLDPRLRVYFNNKDEYDAIRGDEKTNGPLSDEEWEAIADGIVGDKSFEYTPETPSVDPGGPLNIPQYLKAVGSGFKQIKGMSKGQKDILLNKTTNPGDALGIGSGRNVDLNKIAASIFTPQRYNQMRDAALATEQPIPGWAIAELLSGRDPQEMPGIMGSLFKGEGSASDLYRTWGGIGARSLIDMLASSQLGPLGIPLAEMTGLPNLAHTIIDPRAGEDNALGGPIPNVVLGEILGFGGKMGGKIASKVGKGVVNKVKGSLSDVFGTGRYNPKPEFSYPEGAQTNLPSDYYARALGEGASTPLPEGYFGKVAIPDRLNHGLSPKLQTDLDWLDQMAARSSYIRDQAARGNQLDYIPNVNRDYTIPKSQIGKRIHGLRNAPPEEIPSGKVVGMVAGEIPKKIPPTTSGIFGIRKGAQTPIAEHRFDGWPQESPMDTWSKANPLSPNPTTKFTPGEILPEPPQVPTTVDVISKLEAIPPVAPEVPVMQPPPIAPVAEAVPVAPVVSKDTAAQAIQLSRSTAAENAWTHSEKGRFVADHTRRVGKPPDAGALKARKEIFIDSYKPTKNTTEAALKKSGSKGGSTKKAK